MQNKRYKFLLWIPAVLVVGLIVTVIYQGLQQNKTVKSDDKIQVVASLNSYGDIAEAVLGDAGSVTSVIANPDVDPHDFEPTPSTAKQYDASDVIISNGGGLDAWSEKFAQANKQAKSISLSTLYNYQEGDNEHFWYEPDLVEKLTKELVNTYSDIAPDQRRVFEDNAQRYLDKMDKVTSLRNELETSLKGKSVLTTEPIFDPWLKSMGVKVAVPEFAYAVEEGQDPTPAAITAWEDVARQGKAVAVIQNTQATSQLVDQAVKTAKEAKVPVVQVSETKPADVNYVDWQYAQLEAFQEAVK